MARPQPSARLVRAQARIARKLSRIGFALPGSLNQRAMRCGNKACRCKTDPDALHGPYWLWTRKVKGKTVTKMLRPQQVRDYRTWFEASRSLRDLVTELEALSLQAIAEAEGWQDKPEQSGESQAATRS